VILYHMLTGRPPFTDDDAIVVMARHIKTPPRRPIEAAPQANIPVELENVLLRVLSKEPTQRPTTAEAFSQELARAMSLSATATSGVRISLGGTIPPLSSSPQLPPSHPYPSAAGVPNVPVAAVSAPSVPAPPMSAPPVASVRAPAPPVDPESLSALPPAPTDSFELAALRPNRSRMWLIGGIAGALLLGAGAALVFGMNAPAPRPAVKMERPPPVVSAASGAGVAASNAIVTTTPNAAAQPAGGLASAGSGSIPSTTFADLPRATDPTSSPPPRARTTPSPARSPRPSPTPRPTTSPSASGHYGLFE
jgi:serine/threonine protein kinase